MPGTFPSGGPKGV